MKKEDFIEISKSLKNNYGWMKYLERNNISSSKIHNMKPEDIAEKLYANVIEEQHEDVDKNIQQIRLLHEMYKAMSSLLIERIDAIPFYSMLNSFDEFGGIVEEIIEGSVPRYIEDLDIDYNNPKEWVDFICKPDFKLEDLESEKIKFINTNKQLNNITKDQNNKQIELIKKDINTLKSELNSSLKYEWINELGYETLTRIISSIEITLKEE